MTRLRAILGTWLVLTGGAACNAILGNGNRELYESAEGVPLDAASSVARDAGKGSPDLDAFELACGRGSLYRAGAVWPVFGGCPTHINRSPFHGPGYRAQTPQGFYQVLPRATTAPSVDEQGRVYVGAGLSVLRLGSTGTVEKNYTVTLPTDHFGSNRCQIVDGAAPPILTQAGDALGYIASQPTLTGEGTVEFSYVEDITDACGTRDQGARVFPKGPHVVQLDLESFALIHDQKLYADDAPYEGQRVGVQFSPVPAPGHTRYVATYHQDGLTTALVLLDPSFTPVVSKDIPTGLTNPPVLTERSLFVNAHGDGVRAYDLGPDIDAEAARFDAATLSWSVRLAGSLKNNAPLLLRDDSGSERLYVGSRSYDATDASPNSVSILNGADGSVVNVQVSGASNAGLAAGTDNTIYAALAEQGTLASDFQSSLVAIDGVTGRIRWSTSFIGPTNCSSLVDSDGVVYAYLGADSDAGDAHALYAIEPSNGILTVIARFKEPIGAITPLADGILLVSTPKAIYTVQRAL